MNGYPFPDNFDIGGEDLFDENLYENDIDNLTDYVSAYATQAPEENQNKEYVPRREMVDRRKQEDEDLKKDKEKAKLSYLAELKRKGKIRFYPANALHSIKPVLKKAGIVSAVVATLLVGCSAYQQHKADSDPVVRKFSSASAQPGQDTNMATSQNAVVYPETDLSMLNYEYNPDAMPASTMVNESQETTNQLADKYMHSWSSDMEGTIAGASETAAANTQDPMQKIEVLSPELKEKLLHSFFIATDFIFYDKPIVTASGATFYLKDLSGEAQNRARMVYMRTKVLMVAAFPGLESNYEALKGASYEIYLNGKQFILENATSIIGESGMNKASYHYQDFLSSCKRELQSFKEFAVETKGKISEGYQEFESAHTK